jgi:putative hydrolase of the HAD superfamily
VLDYLKGKNYPIHLITNGFEQTQYLKMKHSGIKDYFIHIVTSESTGCLKPGRDIFDFALQKAQCRAAEALMIGDTLEVDIEGALNAGIDQVYYNPAKPAKHIKPTYVINSLSELRSIL